MTARLIITDEKAASCYFRTTVEAGRRKALVQVDERCNLRCGHCFVNATRRGTYMTLEQITDRVIPQLAEARVDRVTLTGGDPFMHPDVIEVVRRFRAAGMSIGLCTNATLTSDEQIAELVEIGDVHVNVSLDGFACESHGKFRGDPESFYVTVDTVKKFAAASLLQGLLCTPNSLAEDEEYTQLCAFAKEHGAKYVLMNPLGEMGRGQRSAKKLRRPDDHMRHIRDLTMPFVDESLDMVHIRFPNDEKPLSGCEAGTIIYVFTQGEVAVCPYLVFAARTRASKHPDTDFIVGNVWTDSDIASRLDAYRFHERWDLGANDTCGSCSMSSRCGKGCPAAVVAAGYRIGAVDSEQCPVVPRQSRVLPLAGVS
jgi:radical SAM protein with 4Fe4S-binding SPASM domain